MRTYASEVVSRYEMRDRIGERMNLLDGGSAFTACYPSLYCQNAFDHGRQDLDEVDVLSIAVAQRDCVRQDLIKPVSRTVVGAERSDAIDSDDMIFDLGNVRNDGALDM